MSVAIVSEKGWIVVPKKYRDKYGLNPGTKVQVVDYGGCLSLVPLPEDPISALRGMFESGPSLNQELFNERKISNQHEEDKVEDLRSR